MNEANNSRVGVRSHEERRNAQFSLFEGQRSVIHMCTRMPVKQWANNREAHMFNWLQLCGGIDFDETMRVMRVRVLHEGGKLLNGFN